MGGPETCWIASACVYAQQCRGETNACMVFCSSKFQKTIMAVTRHAADHRLHPSKAIDALTANPIQY